MAGGKGRRRSGGLRRWLKARRWLIGGGFIALALALGLVGFRDYFAAQGRPRSFWDLWYLTLQLFVLESGSIPGPMGWELEAARLLAPLISAWAAVQALAALFRDQFNGVRARFLRGHAVICGLGRKGSLLARHFHEAGWRVLAIERDDGNDAIAPLRREGITVLLGDAADASMLRKARLPRAGCLIAVAGDDGRNSEIAVRAADALRPRPGRPLPVLAHIVDPELCDLLRGREVATESAPIRLEYFNIYASGARAWLRENPLAAPARLLIVGLGHLGERLIVQAADEWRLVLQRREKLPVTVVDREATPRLSALRLRFPRADEACQLDALDIDACSPEFGRGGFLFDDAGIGRFSAIFVCFDQETLALTSALSLHRCLGRQAAPITVRLEDEAGLARLLAAGAGGGEAGNLRPFAMLDRTLSPDLVLSGTHEVLARAIHEEYLEQQRREGRAAAGDPALRPWESLAECLKESSRLQADHVGMKLMAVGCEIALLRDPGAEEFAFAPDEIEKLATMEHERWLQERRRGGWRYAPGAKDGAGRTSPYMVPYTELAEDAKELDRNTVRKLPRFLARAGFQVNRVVRR